MSIRLGKQEYVPDERTLKLGNYVLPEIRTPTVFDFDKARAAFPTKLWGNDVWGDCVIAAEANHILRLERAEQRRTVNLSEEDAVLRYRVLTGSVKPRDEKDTGLVVIDAMRNWRNIGFLTKVARVFSIEAYGELDPGDIGSLRIACYLLHGIHLGFWLPQSAQHMSSLWDYNGETGADWQPGSWGGHLAFSKAYDANTFEILTWGMKVRVTNRFIARYCDEAWAVVDRLDSWRTKQTFDVQALASDLQQISSKVNQ